MSRPPDIVMRRAGLHERAMASFVVNSQSIFALTFTLICIGTLPGRDVATLATLGAVQGRRGSVLFVATICGVGTVVLAIWPGAVLASLEAPATRTALACLAAALAGLELLFVPLPRPLREPTHSTGALSLVLVFQQLTGGARWLLLALVLASGEPVTAGIAGALAVTLATALAWCRNNWFTRDGLVAARRLAAFPVLLSAAALAIWSARIL